MKALLNYLGWILILSSVFRVIPIVSALIYGESFTIFLTSAAVSLVLGLGLLWIQSGMEKDSALSLQEGIILVALSFILLPIIGSISFLQHFDYNFMSALFESISGFTTTGLTMFDSLDSLPKSIVLWRATTQWMGGIGIIMVFLFLYARIHQRKHESTGEPSKSAQTEVTLYQAQGFSENLETSLRRTTGNIVLIYGGLTVIGILLLYFTGMNLLNSIGMTFTALSTGGFSMADGLVYSDIQLWVLSFLMIMGAISFVSHNKLITGRIKEFFRDFERNAFFFSLIVAIAIGFFAHDGAREVLFTLISSFTTTGYAIGDLTLFPQLFMLLIVIGMVVGGSTASTSGGIKMFRAYSILASIPWVLKKLSNPRGAVIPFKIGTKSVSETTLLVIMIFVSTHAVLLIAGTMALMMMGLPFFDSGFHITSALGTVGLQTSSLAAFPTGAKVILMIWMILGRLELFPLLVLLRRIFKPQG